VSARIAGASPDGGDVKRLLAALSRPGATAHTLSRPGAALGWSGRGTAALGEVEGVVVALDGAIYEPADENEPALVARLYRQHGFEGTIQRLNGDFALALYDPRTDELWLARDRFGVRPLYYARRGERLAFASQPRCLATLDGVDGTPDRRYLAVVAAGHYRVFDNEPERSPYAGVAQLPPGHLLVHRNGATHVTRYWDLAEQDELSGTEEQLAERYRELLADAVAIRLRRAERPAFTLSGGMDSSSVLAGAVRAAGAPQPAYSTVYADATYDERDEIRPMLGVAAEPWRAVTVDDPDVFALVDELVALHDEPVPTATWLSHEVLARRVAADGHVALFGGLGGDELNAGEYEYFPLHFADLRVAGREAELAVEIEGWVRHHDHPIFRKSAAAADDALARLVDLSRPGVIRPDRTRLDRYADALAPGFFDLRAYEPRMVAPFASYLKNRAYQDLFYETLPCCLRAQDRNAAAHGVEPVLPFLDHRLSELMFRVPGDHKIRDGVTKRLLRKAMRGMLPEETRGRVKKTGWNAPAHLWFAGEGRDRLLDIVRSQRFRERGVYDVSVVERIVDEHDEIVRSGRPVENHMMFLWQLVNVDAWLRLIDP
jgi:asparagine synthase (glutamine-hydrolysing)